MNSHQIGEALAEERAELLTALNLKPTWGIRGVQVFMEHHVWAVWDFMSLVKALQKAYTCTEIPWVPVGDPQVRRFVNEVVWGEESDLDRHGKAMSHFEMYLAAMESLGADTSAIKGFLQSLKNGLSLDDALNHWAPEGATKAFVTYTFEVIQQGGIHEVAALFTFGREDLIPQMFLKILDDLEGAHEAELADLKYYFERHIELDGDEHGPIAHALVDASVGNDETKAREALEAARKALLLRKNLWSAIDNQISQRTPAL